jgi:hypothetical protein
VPTFCRHNRFLHSCPICSPQEAAPPSRRAGTAAAPRPRTARTSSPRTPSGVRVRRVARAADDGYANALVPGLRASADARSLADEIAFAAGRLAWLESGAGGVYADAAGSADREDGLLLLASAAAHGPRASGDPERVLAAYSAWATRAGSQAAALGGEPAWTPERRFDRAFERLGSLGFARGARYDLLVALGRLALLDARPSSLHLDDRDDTSLAAKRVFAIGDRFVLDRRSADLAAAAGVPIEALDLALANLDAPERMTLGAPEDVADDEVRARALAALGVAD